MAGTALAVTAGLNVVSSYFGAKGAKEDAKRGKEAARREAEFIKKRNEMEQAIAKEKFALEVAMEEERVKHETEYVIGQLEKKKARVSGEATASYGASGVTIAEGSAENVLERIESEFESEMSMVRETAALGLEQFTESGQKSLDWFLEQSTLETEYGVQSSLSEASAYGSRAQYAQQASIINPLAAGVSGVAEYGMYKESLNRPMTIH